MRVYVATKISNVAEAARAAEFFRERGIEVTSRWIGVEASERPDKNDAEAWAKFAKKWGQNDLEDVLKADVVVAIAVDGMVGTWVEFGIGLGSGKRVILVSKHDYSVFSYVDQVTWVDSIEEAYKELNK